jgi:hypothetical protein
MTKFLSLNDRQGRPNGLSILSANTWECLFIDVYVQHADLDALRFRRLVATRDHRPPITDICKMLERPILPGDAGMRGSLAVNCLEVSRIPTCTFWHYSG